MKPRHDTSKRFSTLDEHGRRRCVWCGTAPLPKGKRSWCSDACVKDYQANRDPVLQKIAAWKRDGGRCRSCNVDLDRLQKGIEKLPHSFVMMGVAPGRRMVFGRRDKHAQSVAETALGRSRVRARVLLGRLLWKVRVAHRSTLWDLDHIVPVVEGGGGCDLDNLRVLCLRCHHAETVALRGRMRRRPKKGMMR